MKSTYWQGLAVTAAMALPFLLGLALVLSPPPGLLGWGALVSLVALPVVILLAIWLKAIGNSDARLVPAVQQGMLVGSIAGMLFIGGIFFPYAAGLGGRDLADFGGEIGWFAILFFGLLVCGLAGATLGTVCGGVAWGLHRAFGAGWRGMVVGGAVLLAASTAAAVSLALVADDGGEDGWSIDDARAFEEFTLYWVGEEYEGLPLRRIIRYRYGPENSVTFVYGSCNPRGEGGCAPPLSLAIQPYCVAPPERYSPRIRSGSPFEIRGARAEHIAHLHVWTNDVAIIVFAEPGLDVEAASQLRLVSEGPDGALKPLGPPSADC